MIASTSQAYEAITMTPETAMFFVVFGLIILITILGLLYFFWPIYQNK